MYHFNLYSWRKGQLFNVSKGPFDGQDKEAGYDIKARIPIQYLNYFLTQRFPVLENTYHFNLYSWRKGQLFNVSKGPFDGQDKEAGYDIISYSYLLFDKPIGHDTLNLLLILSRRTFAFSILTIGWVRNNLSN